MPNLRGKTWTTTTPANVGDAQYWEDHLISDATAAKAASSVQSVNNTTPDAQGNVDVVALPDGGTAGQVLTKQSSVDGDADWEDPTSSGHTIQDEDGVDMPYQDTLQFVNAEVTNDTTDRKTVVDCKGAKGDPGDAATITVGTVTTLPAGSQATVVNTGTSAAAVFNFGIPKGADGSGSGDMTKAEYATNGEAGVVDEAITLKGLTASITDLNKTSNLATVATTGAYSDLSGKPTIPTVDQTYSATSSNAQSGKAVAEVVEQIYTDNGVLGAKNLLGYPYATTTITKNGITFTDNGDGSVTVNGTATAAVDFQCGNNNTPYYYDFVNKYKGTDREFRFAGKTSNVRLQFWSPNFTVYDENAFAFPANINMGNFNFSIHVDNGVTVNNETIYPMMILATDPDDTYVPYAMTNRELTEKVNKSTETFGQVDAYRNNGVVMLKFKGTSITEADGMTLGTLSEKYRPIVEFRTMTKVYNGSSYVDVQVNINTSGVVKLMSTTGQAIASIQPIFTLLTPVFIPSID